MRKEYYKLLTEKNILDIFYELESLSYTKKEKILNKLLEDYSPNIINLALTRYKEKYIDIRKLNLEYLYNTLKYLCKQELIE